MPPKKRITIKTITKVKLGKGVIDSIKEYARRIRNFITGLNEMSPTLRNFLESENGNSKIQQIEVSRAPISESIKKVMNWISLGKFEENQRKLGYDDVYHLSVSIMVNGKWITFDKRPRWSVQHGKLSSISGVDKSQLQGRVISLNGKTLTIAELFTNAVKKVGEHKFFSYSASDNNCQNGITQLLGSSGLLTEEDRAFIKQNAVKLMENSGLLEKVSNFITGLKHRVDGLSGSGRKKEL